MGLSLVPPHIDKRCLAAPASLCSQSSNGPETRENEREESPKGAFLLVG
jgi:hypothetical protein